MNEQGGPSSYNKETAFYWDAMSKAFGLLWGGVGIEDTHNSVTGSESGAAEERNFRRAFLEGWFAAKDMEPPKYRSVYGTGALVLVRGDDE